MLRPLGDRLLIQPDAVPTQTESGLHVVEHWPDEVSGVVVAVGRPKHPRRDEALAHAAALERAAPDTAQLLRELVGRDPVVAPGVRVIFSRQAGQEVQIGETRHFLMRESDLLAVWE